MSHQVDFSGIPAVRYAKTIGKTDYVVFSDIQYGQPVDGILIGGNTVNGTWGTVSMGSRSRSGSRLLPVEVLEVGSASDEVVGGVAYQSNITTVRLHMIDGSSVDLPVNGQRGFAVIAAKLPHVTKVEGYDGTGRLVYQAKP